MNAHDILKQKLLDTEEDHTTGITREEVLCIQRELEELQAEQQACYASSEGELIQELQSQNIRLLDQVSRLIAQRDSLRRELTEAINCQVNKP